MTRPSPPRRSRRIRLGGAVIALLVASAGLFLAGSQLLHKSSPPIGVGARLAGRPAKATSAAASAVSSVAASVHDVLFIGASYTAGLGASPTTEGYAYLIGRQPGWRTQVNGVSGTGFLNPGPHGGQTFADRIAHLPTHPRPDLVVFQGGRNDVNYPSARLRAAAIATAELTYKRFAGAQVVFLGPIPARVPPPPNQIAVETTLRSAAASSKAIFIDPIEQGWITSDNEGGYTGVVPAHPDNRGYAYIARRVLTDLAALYPEHGQA